MQFLRWPCLIFCAMALAIYSANAQESTATPRPSATPNVGPDGYPDIDSLREPGSSAKLFPPATASPAPLVPGQGTDTGPGGGGGGRRNNPLLNGQQHRRNGRTNDLLIDQASADPLEVRVAYRRAKTEAMVRDPELAQLIRQADAADTDLRKRAILKVYYTRLYAEVQKVDRSPEVKRHVGLLALITQQRYDPQRRVVGGEEDIVRGGGGRRGRAQ